MRDRSVMTYPLLTARQDAGFRKVQKIVALPIAICRCYIYTRSMKENMVNKIYMVFVYEAKRHILVEAKNPREAISKGIEIAKNMVHASGVEYYLRSDVYAKLAK